MDRVRDGLAEAGEVEKIKEGNQVFLTLKKSSYAPDMYKEKKEDIDGKAGDASDSENLPFLTGSTEPTTTAEEDVAELFGDTWAADGEP